MPTNREMTADEIVGFDWVMVMDAKEMDLLRVEKKFLSCRVMSL